MINKMLIDAAYKLERKDEFERYFKRRTMRKEEKNNMMNKEWC